MKEKEKKKRRRKKEDCPTTLEEIVFHVKKFIARKTYMHASSIVSLMRIFSLWGGICDLLLTVPSEILAEMKNLLKFYFILFFSKDEIH